MVIAIGIHPTDKRGGLADMLLAQFVAVVGTIVESAHGAGLDPKNREAQCNAGSHERKRGRIESNQERFGFFPTQAAGILGSDVWFL